MYLHKEAPNTSMLRLLEKHPEICPYCQKSDTSKNLVEDDMGSNRIWKVYECEGCDKHWLEEYSLTDVFEEDK